MKVDLLLKYAEKFSEKIDSLAKALVWVQFWFILAFLVAATKGWDVQGNLFNSIFELMLLTSALFVFECFMFNKLCIYILINSSNGGNSQHDSED